MMNPDAARKRSIIGAMAMIRPLLARAGDLSLFSDEEIAEALLHTCPEPNHLWLSDGHLARAHARLKQRL